jgi:hypothetical protein
VPQPPRSARIVLGYSSFGRLRLSLAVTTCHATALSVVSHPVTMERPHRPRHEQTLRVPRAQRQIRTFTPSTAMHKYTAWPAGRRAVTAIANQATTRRALDNRAQSRRSGWVPGQSPQPLASYRRIVMSAVQASGRFGSPWNLRAMPNGRGAGGMPVSYPERTTPDSNSILTWSLSLKT